MVDKQNLGQQQLTPQELKKQFLRPRDVSLEREDIAQQVIARRTKEAETEYYKGVANKLDKQIIDNNYLGTLQNFTNEFNRIDPNVQRHMQVTPRIAQLELNNRISTIKNKIQSINKSIDRSREKERSAKKRDDDKRADYEDAKQDGYRTEKRELEKILPKYNQGDFLDVKQVLSYADDVGDARRDKSESKATATRELKIIQTKLDTGNITKVSYSGGKVSTAIIDGKTYNLRQYNIKDLKLSKVKEVQRENTLRVITNPERFLDNASTKYLTANAQERKKLINEYNTRYGSDVSTAVVETAGFKHQQCSKRKLYANFTIYKKYWSILRCSKEIK